MSYLFCLESGGDNQPRSLWAGTIPGGLFLSQDGGETWTIVESLWNLPDRQEWIGGGYDQPGYTRSASTRGSRRVTIGVSTGGVWTTADAGASWHARRTGCAPLHAAGTPPSQRPGPASHGAVPGAARTLYWVQHHNGIFRSTDGAAVARGDVNPSVFGFAVAVHPRHPDTAWFVPAVKDESRVPVDGKLAVTRTRDGGAPSRC